MISLQTVTGYQLKQNGNMLQEEEKKARGTNTVAAIMQLKLRGMMRTLETRLMMSVQCGLMNWGFMT